MGDGRCPNAIKASHSQDTFYCSKRESPQGEDFSLGKCTATDYEKCYTYLAPLAMGHLEDELGRQGFL